MPERSYDRPDQTTSMFVRYTHIYGAAPPVDTTSTQVVRLVRGYYSGARTKDYFKKVKAGVHLPHHAYERFDFIEVREPGTYHGTFDNGSKSYSYDQNPTRSVGSVARTKEDMRILMNERMGDVNINLLQQQAFDNISSQLDLLTSMAELSKTLSMLLNARREAQKLIKQALKGGFQTAKAASTANLQWRYGWRILGYEIEAAVKSWNDPLRGKILTGKSGDSIKSEDIIVSHDDNYYVSYDRVATIQYDFSFHASASADFGGPTLNFLANPVNTLWELVPFSFVADWFVSIGSLIRALGIAVSAKSTYSSFGYKFTQSAQMVVSNVTIGTGVNADPPFSASGNASSEGVLRGRIPLGRLSLIPQLYSELDWRKIIDLASIFILRIF